MLESTLDKFGYFSTPLAICLALFCVFQLKKKKKFKVYFQYHKTMHKLSQRREILSFPFAMMGTFVEELPEFLTESTPRLKYKLKKGFKKEFIHKKL